MKRLKILTTIVITTLILAFSVCTNAVADELPSNEYSLPATYTVQDSYVITMPERVTIYSNIDDYHCFEFEDMDLAENHSLYIEVANLTNGNDIFLKSKSKYSAENTGAHVTFKTFEGTQITKEQNVIGVATNDKKVLIYYTDIALDDGVRAGECEGIITYRFRVGETQQTN